MEVATRKPWASECHTKAGEGHDGNSLAGSHGDGSGVKDILLELLGKVSYGSTYGQAGAIGSR